MTHLKNLFVIGILIMISMASSQCMEDSTKLKQKHLWYSTQIVHGSGVFENFKDFTVLSGSAFGLAPSISQRVGFWKHKSTYISLGLRIHNYNGLVDVNNEIKPLFALYLAPTFQLHDHILLGTSKSGDLKMYINPSAGIIANYLFSKHIWDVDIQESDIASNWTYGFIGGLGFICKLSEEFYVGAGGQYEMTFSFPDQEDFTISQLSSLYISFGKTIGRTKGRKVR